MHSQPLPIKVILPFPCGCSTLIGSRLEERHHRLLKVFKCESRVASPWTGEKRPSNERQGGWCSSFSLTSQWQQQAQPYLIINHRPAERNMMNTVEKWVRKVARPKTGERWSLILYGGSLERCWRGRLSLLVTFLFPCFLFLVLCMDKHTRKTRENNIDSE